MFLGTTSKSTKAIVSMINVVHPIVDLKLALNTSDISSKIFKYPQALKPIIMRPVLVKMNITTIFYIVTYLDIKFNTKKTFIIKNNMMMKTSRYT